jgi:hypothetical protein
MYTCGSGLVCAADAVWAVNTDPAIAAAITRTVANLRIGLIPHSVREFVTNKRYAAVRGLLMKSKEIERRSAIADLKFRDR